MNAQKQDLEETPQHIPVMLDEVLEALQPKEGGIYVDGTFGVGGYTRALLETAQCTVYAIDRDPEAHERAKAMAREFSGRLFPVLGAFGNLAQLLAAAEVRKVDGIVLDLGVSSLQLGTALRGFSFQQDGPLDMRMGADGMSARDAINTLSEEDLASVIFAYGEERASRRIAKKIVETRKEKPLETTRELAKVIHSVLPMHGGLKTDTATRTFQALRIYVNDELAELERVLNAAEELLTQDGRLVVVSFHSLEDSIVKNFLKERSGRQPNASRHLPPAQALARPSFRVERAGVLKPSEEEIARNPRARSARLRCGIRE